MTEHVAADRLGFRRYQKSRPSRSSARLRSTGPGNPRRVFSPLVNCGNTAGSELSPAHQPSARPCTPTGVRRHTARTDPDRLHMAAESTSGKRVFPRRWAQSEPSESHHSSRDGSRFKVRGFVPVATMMSRTTKNGCRATSGAPAGSDDKPQSPSAQGPEAARERLTHHPINLQPRALPGHQTSHSQPTSPIKSIGEERISLTMYRLLERVRRADPFNPHFASSFPPSEITLSSSARTYSLV